MLFCGFRMTWIEYLVEISHIQLINTTLMIRMLKRTYYFRYRELNIWLECSFFSSIFSLIVFDAWWCDDYHFLFQFLSCRHISPEQNYQLATMSLTWNQFLIKAYVLYRRWLMYAPIVDGFRVHWLACIFCRWLYRWMALVQLSFFKYLKTSVNPVLEEDCIVPLILYQSSKQRIYIYIYISLTKSILPCQGLWFERDSSLWMLPSMNDDILEHLKGRGVSTVPSLLNLSREELHRLLQPFSASELCQVLLSRT